MFDTPTAHFHQVAAFDELDHEEVELRARRLVMYSPEALKVGLVLDKIFVVHERFSGGLEQLDRLFQIAPEVSMAHGMSLIGPPGSGKTTLLKFFCDSLPKSTLFTKGHGAIGIRAGANPTSGQLITALLRAYRYPFTGVLNRTVYAKRDNVFDVIRAKGTRLVFVDEAHRLRLQWKRRNAEDELPEATEFLHDMMDECRVGLVLCGTADLDRLTEVDKHLCDRVTVRHELRHFTPDAHWHGILRAFVRECTWFDLSILQHADEAKLLHHATSGNLRALKRLLTEAVLVAAQAGKTLLDRDSLAQAFTLVQGRDSMKVSPYA